MYVFLSALTVFSSERLDLPHTSCNCDCIDGWFVAWWVDSLAASSLAYWIFQFQVVHIWEYDSFAHRKSVRAALAEDPEWTGIYISKLVQYLQKQDNVALTLLPWSEVEHPEQSGGDARF